MACSFVVGGSSGPGLLPSRELAPGIMDARGRLASLPEGLPAA